MYQNLEYRAGIVLRKYLLTLIKTKTNTKNKKNSLNLDSYSQDCRKICPPLMKIYFEQTDKEGSFEN